MKKIVLFLIIFFVGGIIALGLWAQLNTEESNNEPNNTADEEDPILGIEEMDEQVEVEPFFEFDEETVLEEEEEVNSDEIISSEPSRTVKAIYYTSYSASSESRIESLIELASNTEINAVVIDANNFTGHLSYDSEIPEVNEYNLDSNRIQNLPLLIERLQNNDIYVIARLTVMQNTALAEARPDLALKSSSTGEIWRDTSGQAWVDPASDQVKKYVSEVAKELSSLGFDEINFDYIRFPSDGDLDNIDYPVWDGETLKINVLESFFKHLRNELPDTTLSIDVFGLITTNRNGLGIGQLLEDVFMYFDVVSPMVYPSHYADGSFGIEKPAENPYEIILVSLVNSVLRIPGIETFDDYRKKKKEFKVEIRPWLQDFDLGANYGPEEIRLQIQAVNDALGEDAGFMMWNARNVYTRSAF